MEWGRWFSPEAYEAIMSGMISDEMYWGDDFDQQQAYVDVHGILVGLRDGSTSTAEAVRQLRQTGRTELRPWLKEDLEALTTAWREAAALL
jgi:hypothetical protein